MIIQAELRRKQSEYEGDACVVDKVIELPAQRFQQFSRALLADYDFIAENKTAIRHDTDSRHCLLMLYGRYYTAKNVLDRTTFDSKFYAMRFGILLRPSLKSIF